MSIKTLKSKVESVLINYPETRNCDILLTRTIWKIFYPEYLIKREKDGLDYIAVENLDKVPREDHIKRIRAKFQNEQFKYLPTDEKVAIRRKLNIENWRSALGY